MTKLTNTQVLSIKTKITAISNAIQHAHDPENEIVPGQPLVSSTDIKLLCIIMSQQALLNSLLEAEKSVFSDHKKHYAFLIDKYNIARKALESIQSMQISYDGTTVRQIARQALIDIDRISKLEIGKVSKVLSNG
jgi:hypothetical protein